jgi:hypothetical protein
MIRHFAKKFGDMRSTNEVGDLVGSALRNEKEAHRALVRTEVGNLDRLGRNEVMVDISDILDAAKAGKRANKSRGNRGVGIERLYDFILLSEKGTVAPGIGAAKGARARQVERVGRSSRVTFKEAQEMRSLLLEAERATDDPLPKITEALAGDLAQKVHGKMELAAKLSGNNRLLQAWQGFNDLVSGGHTQFNNQVMRELMGHTEASRVYTEGIRGMVPPERIRAIRGIIEKGVAGGRVDPIVWQDVQGRWMRDAIEGAVSVETGSVRGKALLEHLKTVGPERMRALFPEDGGAGFRRFARTLYLTQKTATEKEAGGTFGGVAMRILQAGAVLTYPVAMWKGEGETRAATTANLAFILLGPAALARALRNPKAISLITRGMTTGPVEGASRLGNQLQVHLRDILPPGSAYVGEVTDPNRPARSATPTDPPSIESLAPRGGQ